MPKHDWDKFRADIERLYMAEGKALSDVANILATTRGFRARFVLPPLSFFPKTYDRISSIEYCLSPHAVDAICLTWVTNSNSAYEKQLRKWGLKKNAMGQRNWKAVARIVEKRKNMGKSSEVYVQGIMVLPEKLQREISRHVLPTLRSKFPGNIGMSPP